uniref:Uncharacterized protein n=1 Tax=Anguilla anguilla TaxID=7936 RepID=A0A0E9PCJ1_ANGAN
MQNIFFHAVVTQGDRRTLQIFVISL